METSVFTLLTAAGLVLAESLSLAKKPTESPAAWSKKAKTMNEPEDEDISTCKQESNVSSMSKIAERLCLARRPQNMREA